MENEMAVTAWRVREGAGFAIRVEGVTHSSSTTSPVVDGAVYLRGKRAGRALFVVVHPARHFTPTAGGWKSEAVPGTVAVEGTRASESDARRFAAKLTGGRVVPVIG